MNNEKMGFYIATLRKSKNMSQKELAEKLNITDKAVSKWERGLSSPDISLLKPLANIFDVSIEELINGEKSDLQEKDTDTSIDTAIKYADNVVKREKRSLHNIFLLAFSAILLIGIIVCAIVDVAISQSFTWSPIPIVSVIFTFLVFAPSIKCGIKGFIFSLITFSVFVIPFLFVLNLLIESNGLIIAIGLRASIVVIAYLWIDFLLYKKLKSRVWLATAITVLLVIPVNFLINLIISLYIEQPKIDIWDIMTYSILLIISLTFFIVDYFTRKKTSLGN